MSSYLEVCGVQIPVVDHSRQPQRQGARSRADSGAVRNSVRSTCYDHTFQTDYLDAAHARALRGLLEGDGFVLNFENTDYTTSYLWSSRGHVPAVVYPDVSRDTSRPAFGTGALKVDGGQVSFNLPRTPEWTLLSWTYSNSDGWSVYLIRSNNSYLEGADPGFLPYDTETSITLEGLGYSVETYADATQFALLDSNGEIRHHDDVVFLPYLVPDDWCMQMQAYHLERAWPALPVVFMAGDCVASTTGPCLAQGELGEVKATAVGGQVLESFPFTLMQTPGELPPLANPPT